MPEGRWVQATTRPVIMGRQYMVSAGHYLAAAAAARILDAGGNAFDAGAAGGLAINVVQPEFANLGGVAPICLYRADTGMVETISGLGWWPAAASAEFFNRECGGTMPPGINKCVLPAAIDAWLTVLEQYGTMTFAEVAAPAVELAEHGFAVNPVLRETLSAKAALTAIRSWPASREIFLTGAGELPAVGEVLVQADLARTLKRLIEAERAAGGREAGIQAARARFYTGDIAQAIADYCEREGGWITMADLAEFQVEIEPPVHVNYRGYEVYACGPWCQGPVVPMALNILSGYDIESLTPGSVEVYHLVLEALKAAFADRDRYFGDPRYVSVPVDGLLHPEYGAQWRSRISRDKACPGMPEPGDPWPFSAKERPAEDRWTFPTAGDGPLEPDTSYLCVVDREGNAFSATPSDSVRSAPIIPGLGVMMSSRGTQSWLDQNHPSAMAPGRRPRLTPNPGMVLKDGQLFMAYGTPGLDMQPQAMVQFLLNVIDFKMTVQEAIEAPRCGTYSYPASSDPHRYLPGVANIESRAGAEVIEGLRRLGHDIAPWPAFTGTVGSVEAILVDQETGVLHGGADPRLMAYAIGR